MLRVWRGNKCLVEVDRHQRGPDRLGFFWPGCPMGGMGGGEIPLDIEEWQVDRCVRIFKNAHLVRKRGEWVEFKYHRIADPIDPGEYIQRE